MVPGGSYEREPKLLSLAAERLLSTASDPGLSVHRAPPVEDTLAEVAGLIEEHTVVVLRYLGESRFTKGVDHWVCAVASDAVPLRLHVACSIRWSDVYRFTEEEYEELEVEHGRRANDWLAEPSAKLAAGSALLVRAV